MSSTSCWTPLCRNPHIPEIKNAEFSQIQSRKHKGSRVSCLQMLSRRLLRAFKTSSLQDVRCKRDVIKCLIFIQVRAYERKARKQRETKQFPGSVLSNFYKMHVCRLLSCRAKTQGSTCAKSMWGWNSFYSQISLTFIKPLLPWLKTKQNTLLLCVHWAKQTMISHRFQCHKTVCEVCVGRFLLFLLCNWLLFFFLRF